MAEMKPVVERVRILDCGHEFHAEFKHFPVAFVNGLRRILLASLPVVVARDVEIVENTTKYPHEMLKHRVEMLPINVLPSESSVIREATIELRSASATSDKVIHTSDFVVARGPPTLLMGDRDTGAPLLFTRMKAKDSLHIRAKLAVETETASHVCVASLSYHPDPERVKEDREAFIEDEGEPAVFDNFYIQKSYSRDEDGRPNWIDLHVKSIGVIAGKELVRMAVGVLKQKVADYIEKARENIERLPNSEYRITIQMGGHTELAVLQQILYSDKNVDFVSYDIPHPLKPDTNLRLKTSMNPDTILTTAHGILNEYCQSVYNGIGVRPGD